MENQFRNGPLRSQLRRTDLGETRPERLKLRPREGKPRMSEGQREEQSMSSIGRQLVLLDG